MYNRKVQVVHCAPSCICVNINLYVFSGICCCCCFSFDFESVESTMESSVDKSKPWSRSIEDLHRGSNLPSPAGNSVSRSGRHSALRWVPLIKREANLVGYTGTKGSLTSVMILGHVVLYPATQHLYFQWFQMKGFSGVPGIIIRAVCYKL